MMQIPHKDLGLESDAAVTCISSKPMSAATSRTEITGRHAAIRDPDPGSELCIRQAEIRPVTLSNHFRTRRDILRRRRDQV